jgi:hypothetical protein
MKKERDPIWICDRCKAERTGNQKPKIPSDNWGYLKIDQDSGFDNQNISWAPRMRDALLLCGKCIEDVVVVINTCPGIEIEPGVHSGCSGKGGDCPVCGK